MAEDPSGQILETILKAAKEDREDFLKTGKEISSYAYDKDYEEDYKSFMPEGVNIPFKAKLAKMAQAIDLFGPYLYPANPTRRVVSRPWADQYAQARNQAIEAFLNYTPNETDLYGESCSAIVDALAFGRGVMWTGYDSRKQLVCSVADSVENLYVDPDGRTLKQCNWKARRRIKPRWEVIQKFPNAAAIINELDSKADRKGDIKSRSKDHATEMVEYFEVYCRVGLHNYREGFDLVNQERDQGMADDSPRKYVVAGNKILESGNWDTPLHIDGDWPCTELDFRERPNRVWPSSPLQPGLCHQRALNWVYTVFINRMRNSFRKIFGVLDAGSGAQSSLSEDEVQKAIYGDDLEVIRIPWNGQDDVDIRKVIQELTISSGSDEFEKFYGVISKEFEDATGLTPLIMSGDIGYQARIKADVEMKDTSSKTRLNFWKDRVEKWQGKLARKEALTAMFLQPRDVIGKIFGQQAQQVWGKIMPPEMVDQHRQIFESSPQIQQSFVQGDDSVSPFGIDFDRALREADYTIESGSMRAKTPEQAQDAAEIAMNNVLPVLERAQLYGPLLVLVKSWAQLNNMPQEIVSAFDAAQQQVEQNQQMAAQQQGQQEQAAQQQAQMQAQQQAQAQEMEKQKAAAKQQMQDQSHAHEIDKLELEIQHQQALQQQAAKAQEHEIQELRAAVERMEKMLMEKEEKESAVTVVAGV